MPSDKPTTGDEWRPIEDAPKNAYIDVWLDTIDGHTTKSDVEFYCCYAERIGPGRYGGRSPLWRWDEANKKFKPVGGLGGPVFVTPTHWRNVPGKPQ